MAFEDHHDHSDDPADRTEVLRLHMLGSITCARAVRGIVRPCRRPRCVGHHGLATAACDGDREVGSPLSTESAAIRPKDWLPPRMRAWAVQKKRAMNG